MGQFDKPEELLSFFRRAADFTSELLAENDKLRRELGIVEERSQKHADRYARIEEQNELLQNLFVVIHQLHATLEPDEVLTAIREVVVNVLGAEEYAIWVEEGSGGAPKVAAQEGLAEGDARLQPPPLMRELGGKAWALGKAGSSDPIAVLQLRAGERTVARVAIYKLLRQKKQLGRADEEVMDLLSAQGGAALFAARLAKQA